VTAGKTHDGIGRPKGSALASRGKKLKTAEADFYCTDRHGNTPGGVNSHSRIFSAQEIWISSRCEQNLTARTTPEPFLICAKSFCNRFP